MKIRARPLCVEAGKTVLRGPGGSLRLRRFQEEVVEFFKQAPDRYLFLSAPTGSGKTLTILAPLIARHLGGPGYEGVLAVYPTRALVGDQFSSLVSTLRMLGAREASIEAPVMAGDLVRVLEADITVDGVRKEYRIGLLMLTSESLEKLGEHILGDSLRRNVLKRIVEELWIKESIDYMASLAVPEYPYLLMSKMYSNPDASTLLGHIALGEVRSLARRLVESRDPSEVERIRREARRIYGSGLVRRELLNILSGLGDVVFMDEYHVWGGFEKPAVLALIAGYSMLEPFLGVEYRIAFSSATPDPLTLELVEGITGSRVKIIEAGSVECGEGGNTDIIRGPTEIELVPVDGRVRGGPMGWLDIDRALPSIVEERIEDLLSEGRFMVIGRRVATVEEAARLFEERTGKTPIIVTGIEHPEYQGRETLKERRESGELYLFGNFAIEIGIDIKNINYGIVVAATRSELVQRAGRIGRGPVESRIIIPVPEHYYEDLASELAGSSPTYVEALDAITRRMWERLEAEDALGEILRSRLGRIRFYLPLSSVALGVIASDKVQDSQARRCIERYLRALDAIGFGGEEEEWLLARVSRSPQLLKALASFRVAWSIPYIRGGKQRREVHKASWSSILMNFEVKEVERGVLVLGEPGRRSASQVLKVETLNWGRVRVLADSIMPSRVVAPLILRRGVIEKLLHNLLHNHYEPVYVASPSKLYETLHVYGYAIKVVDKEERVVAYLVPL